MMQSAGIVVNDVTVTWRNGHTALRDASFTVPGGSIAALVGVNGSGKSTLFKAIMGFVRLTSGKISVLGIPTRQALQKNLVAYVPQSEEVDWSFPVLVEDVVMMGRYGHGYVAYRQKEGSSDCHRCAGTCRYGGFSPSTNRRAFRWTKETRLSGESDCTAG